MERDLPPGFLWQFAQPIDAGIGAALTGAATMGAVSMGTAPMTMGSHKAGGGIRATGAAVTGMRGATGITGSMGTMGHHAPHGGGGGAAMVGYGPSAGYHGGGLLGSFVPGANLFSNSEFELYREQRGGILSVWSSSSQSYFGGMDGPVPERAPCAQRCSVAITRAAR